MSAMWAQVCRLTGEHGHMGPSPAHRFSSLPGNQVARVGRSGTKLPAPHQLPAALPLPHNCPAQDSPKNWTEK